MWLFLKGQLILKANWHAIDIPKKQQRIFFLFAYLLFTANKSNLSLHFLGESMARQSTFSFFWPLKKVKFSVALAFWKTVVQKYADAKGRCSGLTTSPRVWVWTQQMDEFIIVVKMNSFICFLGEFKNTKSPFKIIWLFAFWQTVVEKYARAKNRSTRLTSSPRVWVWTQQMDRDSFMLDSIYVIKFLRLSFKNTLVYFACHLLNRFHLILEFQM